MKLLKNRVYMCFTIFVFLTGCYTSHEAGSNTPSSNNPSIESINQPTIVTVFPQSDGKIDMTGTNQWTGTMEKLEYNVTAGALKSDPKVGVLSIVGEANDKSMVSKAYSTPGNHGAIKIIKMVNYVFTLGTDDGTEFVFDLKTRQYENHQK